MTIPFTSIVAALPGTVPFVGPEALERQNGKRFAARLGANESAFGISPKAKQAIIEYAGVEGCSWYGDPESFELRSLLAEQHGISMDNICVDAGIDSLLGLSIRLFVDPGTCVVTSQGAYPTVNYHVNAFGGVLHTVAYRENHEDPAALCEAANEKQARLVYLANPDNPMGTCNDAGKIDALIKGLPESCLLLLDEAYIDFMADGETLPFTVSDRRVLRFRTFSKAYGMAGMRIGYVMAHSEIISAFDKVRNHFGVNRLAQIAALASLTDSDFLPLVRDKVSQGRERIYALARSLDLDYITSATNFVAVDFGNRERADSVVSALGKAGVFMRKPVAPPIDQYVRFGVGSEQEHAYLESVIRNCL